MPFDLKNAICAYLKGDLNAFENIYQSISPKMFGICMRYAGNREEAKDILQDGFIKISQQIQNYQFEGSFEGWARKIMINTALDYYRSKMRWKMKELDESNEVVNMESDEDILGCLSYQEILLMVQELSPTYRLIFNLYAFEGLKHREIAEKLNISEGTSKSNLADARRILKRRIEACNQYINDK
jgi:RNA polymerase sigma-70 factor, ECF subfamily